MKNFSLKYACEKGIDKIRGINWEGNQYIELVLIGATPAPYAIWHVSENYILRLPVKGIDPDAKTFTFIDNIQSYEEYFDKHIFPALMKKVNAMRKKCKRG